MSKQWVGNTAEEMRKSGDPLGQEILDAMKEGSGKKVQGVVIQTPDATSPSRSINVPDNGVYNHSNPNVN